MDTVEELRPDFLLASYKYTGVQIFMNQRNDTTVFDGT